jgi:AcrR family transcriptional regulator
MFEPDDDLIIQDDRPTRSDALRNHRRLLDAARRLFDKDDVEAVSMTQIAQEAGVGKGTLYRNFENKVDLCYALLDEDQRQMQNNVLQRMRTNDDLEANLRWFLQEAATFVIRNENLLYAGADAGQAITLELPAHLWWRQTIRNILRQMDVTGDIDFLSDTFYVMLHVNTIHFQLHTLNYTPQRIYDGIQETLNRVIG